MIIEWSVTSIVCFIVMALASTVLVICKYDKESYENYKKRYGRNITIKQWKSMSDTAILNVFSIVLAIGSFFH